MVDLAPKLHCVKGGNGRAVAGTVGSLTEKFFFIFVWFLYDIHFHNNNKGKLVDTE